MKVCKFGGSSLANAAQITKVIDNGCEFEKTPTKKIRRFVYEQRAKNGFIPDSNLA